MDVLAVRWPYRRPPYGEEHLPLEVRRALAAGLLRREFVVLVGRTRQNLVPGAQMTLRVEVSNEAHFEWIQTTTDTRTAGRFIVSEWIELPQPQSEPIIFPVVSDLVAWESVSGTGAQPYWQGPVFVPAGCTIVVSPLVADATGGAFNVYVVGARFVR